MAKIYPFRGCGFHTPAEWKIGYKVINKQTIVQILIVNTALYIYGNIRLKEISILNSFEQILENNIAGLAFSAQLGRGFHTRPFSRCQQFTLTISWKQIIFFSMYAMHRYLLLFQSIYFPVDLCQQISVSVWPWKMNLKSFEILQHDGTFF